MNRIMKTVSPAVPSPHSRRHFLRGLASLSCAGLFALPANQALAGKTTLKSTIPGSGEQIPVIGAGTRAIYDVGTNRDALINLHKVLKAFFVNGGKLIDSAPSDGSSEDALGFLLSKIKHGNRLFNSSKYTPGSYSLEAEVESSSQRLQRAQLDLVQFTDMHDWQVYVDALQALKEAGKIRYTGLYLSDLKDQVKACEILQRANLDFIQLPYNPAQRDAELRLLSCAAETGTAVIAGRPFAGGTLMKKAGQRPLPSWAASIDCHRWSQIFLKFAISHPAVTCTVPGTSQVHHMLENMGANFGALPDAAIREKIVQTVAEI